MVTTVTCNPAIDKFYVIPAQTQEVVTRLRPEQVQVVAGGKGINVARVFQRLGVPVMATGIVGGFTGAWIRHELDRERIPHEFIQVEEESRLHVTVLPASLGGQTPSVSSPLREWIEPGPPVTSQDEEELIYTVRFLAQQSRAVVLSGSLPPGASPDLYARLIEVIRQAGAQPILDTHGEPLRRALPAGPFLAKPNRAELAELVGDPLADEQALLRAGQQVVEEYRLPWLVVSLGGQGALAWHEDGLYRVHPVPLAPVNTVGGGDSWVGGFVAAWQEQRSPLECLRVAGATAAASVSGLVPGGVTRSQVEQLEGEVRVEMLAG